jgi:hypothetical protein
MFQSSWSCTWNWSWGEAWGFLSGGTGLYRIPTMNLLANIWRATNVITNPPDVASVKCCLMWDKRVHVPGFTLIYSPEPGIAIQNFQASLGVMTLGLPALTDIRRNDGPTGQWTGDLVEVPAESGRYYVVEGVDDVAKGFSNEYRAASIVPATDQLLAALQNPWEATAWPTPYP